MTEDLNDEVMTMLKKWFVSALAVTAMAMLLPADASAQLGKGGGDKGGGKGEAKGGGKSGGETKGGGKSGGETKGGGKSGGGETKGGGGGQSGGSGGGSRGGGETKGGGKSGGGETKGGGGETRGGGSRGGGETKGGGGGQSGGSGGGLGKGGGSGSGGSGSGGGSRGGGGGQSGGSGGGLGKGGGSGSGGSGGGSNGGSGGGTLGRGGGSGSSGGGTRGGGDTRGGGQSNGGLGKGTGSGGGYDRGQGSTQRTMPPTRGGNDRQVFDRNGIFNKTQSGRTGGTSYGTSRNQITRSGNGNVRFGDAPQVRGNNKGIRDVLREDRTIVHDNRYREGYWHYSNRWVDDWFYYPHYTFAYIPGRCYPSPFYYYPHVPGYISAVRVVIGDFRFVITARERYDWRRPSYGGGYRYDYDRYDRYDLIDYQIDNLVTAFETGRVYPMDRMIPRNGTVHVALEDYSDYRMYSDDFYDLMADIVEGTDTRSYRIRDVRYDRNQYVVYAEHEFRDPWGRMDRKFHTIVFERDREGYEIVYFRVDRHPDW